jgi:hypothetical protein
MRRFLERTFEVDAPPGVAWDHLARVERWPTWAKHIRSVTLEPAGPLGPHSAGVIRLANRITSRFAMTAFEPGRRWTWAGKFLWLRVSYDHRFEPTARGGTRIAFTVDGGGFGSGSLGRLFAKAYAGNLDRAIPNLVAELAAAPDAAGR